MNYQFQFRPYQRKFVRRVMTSHGSWDVREGIIIRLTDDLGGVGWGEIAPISWFGSESLEEALSFCCGLPREITDETIFSIPDELSACQFGFESAGEMNRRGRRGASAAGGFPSTGDWRGAEKDKRDLSYSGLLSAGSGALIEWERLWNEGYCTFKWKIGVYPIAEELKIFELLTQVLPVSAKLRLDANGGLSYEEAKLWLWTCENVQTKVEFIEQPLSVDKFDAMLELSDCYETAIALDESVATLRQLVSCYRQGWREIFAIKPGIVGSPSRLRQFCQQYEIDAVFSSVFETAIGRQASLQIAAELSRSNRAVGFGVHHLFAQEEETWLKNLW